MLMAHQYRIPTDRFYVERYLQGYRWVIRDMKRWPLLEPIATASHVSDAELIADLLNKYAERGGFID